MSTVKEAYDTLGELISQGHSDLELIYEDVRSGDTGSASISNSISEVDGTENTGRLCDEEVGTKYVKVYCDH